jgi:ATP-dependent DNA ligase
MNQASLLGLFGATVTWIPIRNRTSAERGEVRGHKMASRTALNCTYLFTSRQPAVAARGLPAEKMKECVSLKPGAIAQIQFLVWTGADHLRRTKFVALRDDKDPRGLVKET